MYTDTFTTQTTHTHLIFCDLAFHFVFNRSNAGATSRMPVQNTHFEARTPHLSLQLQQWFACLVKDKNFSQPFVSHVPVDMAKRLKELIKFLQDGPLQIEVYGIFLERTGFKCKF